MIGAHELLLIVRAQNQASAALGRVSRDVRALEARRLIANKQQSLAIRQSQLSSQMARNEARIQSVIGANGTRRLAIEKQRLAIGNHQLNIQNRIKNIEGRQHSIDTQRLRNANRLWDLQFRQAQAAQKLAKFTKDAKITTDKLGRTRVGGKGASLTGFGGTTLAKQAALQHNLEKLDRQIVETEMAGKSLTYREQALGRTAGELTQAIKSTELAMKQLNAREVDQIAESKALAAQQQILIRQYKLVTLQQQELNAAIAEQKWENIATGARAVSHLGRVMQLFGLISVASLGYAAKAAADFSTKLTLAATQARAPGAPVASVGRKAQQLNKIVLDQMQRFPATADEMGQALFNIFSGTNVRNMGQAAKLLTIFNKEAVAGGIDLDTMTQAGITLFNNFPKEFANATRAGNKFFSLVKFGRGNAQDFANSLAPIIPIAKETGQTFDEVSTTLAFLSRQNKNVMQNSQGYARLLLLIGRPEVRAGFKKLGIQVTDGQGRVRNLLDIVTELQKKVKLTPVQAINFFKDISKAATGRGTAGTIQAQRVWAYLIQGVNQYRKVSKQVLSDNDEFTKSFEALSKSPGVRWRVFINQLKALVIILGQGAMPAFVSMARAVKGVAQWFNNLSDSTKKNIGYLAAVLSVMTLLSGVVLTLGGSFAAFILWIRTAKLAKFATEATKATGAVKVLGSEAGAIALRGALGLGIPVAIFLLIKYHKQVEKVVHALGGLQHVIIALTIAMAAFKVAKMLTAMGLLGAASVATAGEVGILEGALLALGGPEVLAALAALAAALFLIEGLTAKNKGLPGTIKQTDKGTLIRRHGQFTVIGPHNPRSVYNPSRDTRNISPTEASREFGINQPHKAIVKAIEDSPRYQHAIYANQKAVDKFTASLDKNGHHLTRAAPGLKPATASWNQLFKNTERLRRLAEKSPSVAHWAAYYRALAALQAASTKAQFKAAEKMLNDVGSAAKSTQKQVSDQAQQTLDSMLQNLQSMYDNFKQQNQTAFGQLFQGPHITGPLVQNRLDWGGMLNTKDLLLDLKMQVGAFETWRKDLNRLISKGLPQTLIDQVMQLGPEATQKQVELLNKMTPAQLKQYKQMWLRGQKDINDATMRDLNRQLAIYMKHGQNIARAIIAGIRSEDVGVQDALKNMIKQMFPNLVAEAKKGAHAHGARQQGRKAAAATSSSTTNSHNTTHVNVTVKHDGASTPAQIKHAAWVAANRYHHR